MTLRCLSDPALLRVWESGTSLPPLLRPLTTLAASYPENDWDTLTRLSIGQRDACLLEVRRGTFGAMLNARSECPACGERLELTLDVADLLGSAPYSPPLNADTLHFAAEGYEIILRLPNTLDLQAIATCPDASAARQFLLERCVHSVTWEGKTVRLADLPDPMLSALEAEIETHDPLANINLSLNCPACGHSWLTHLDVAAFVWAEIDAEARRLLRDVHQLARVYHWREVDILAMSRQRRQTYLNLMNGDKA